MFRNAPPISTHSQAATFKVATLSPDGSFWMKTMREAGKEVAAATDNRVEFKCYPGGVMGDDKAVLRKMRVGQLQGAALPMGELLNFYPDFLSIQTLTAKNGWVTASGINNLLVALACLVHRPEFLVPIRFELVGDEPVAWIDVHEPFTGQVGVVLGAFHALAAYGVGFFDPGLYFVLDV